MSFSTLRWPLFAIIGLLVAVAVALLATSLVSERIGISSEPITAGQSLSPKRDRPAERRQAKQGPSAAPAQTTSTATGPGYVGSSSDDPGRSDAPSGSGGSDGGDPKQGALAPSSTPPAGAAPAPSAPTAPSGAADTSIEIEPGDD